MEIDITSPTLFCIYRAVGGNKRRNSMAEFDIIRYEVVKETPRYYWVRKQGRRDEFEMQQKRHTSNSRLYPDAEEALQDVQQHILRAQTDLTSSFVKVSASTFLDIPQAYRLYIVKFNGRWTKEYSEEYKDKFSVKCYRIYGKTGRAWQIDTLKTKTVTLKRSLKDVERYAGRTYIYPYVSRPYDPSRPSEQWIDTDWLNIKKQIDAYKDARHKYLISITVKLSKWVHKWKEQEVNDIKERLNGNTR